MILSRSVPLIIVQIIISYVNLCSQTIAFPNEIEDCTTNSGQIGTCIHIEDCPEAQAKLKLREPPKICSFEGIYPIVCCDLFDVRSRRSIAEEKCSEYRTKSIPTTTTTTTTTTTPKTPGDVEYVRLFAIGGEEATPLEFPHMAILGYGSADDVQWNCGGSLISESFVLTAGHCIYSKYGKVAYVQLGVHQISSIDFIQTFNVKNVYIHPNYAFSQNYHDIALIELDRPADIQAGIKPACLYTAKELSSNQLVAIGWGATELYEANSDTLQKVNLTYVPHNICAQYYKPQERLSNGLKEEWHVCADGGGNRVDTCQGDSGGPLQFPLNDESLYTIVGVTSFGFKCAVVPAVYTRVSSYVRWIESIVWPK